MLFTTLTELKAKLEIESDDQSEDLRLGFWIREACGLIENDLGYGVFRQERTEYYKGSGTQKLVLKSHPVYVSPTPQVWVDESGKFGQGSGGFDGTTQLVYGQDYYLMVDSGTDRSKSGILIRNSGFWNKTPVRVAGLLSPFLEESWGTIKVTYTGGHFPEDLPSEFVVAATTLVARMRFMMPLGLPVSSDSFEARSVNIALTSQEKNWLLGQVRHLYSRFKRRRF